MQEQMNQTQTSTPSSGQGTITVKLPKINWQTSALILVVVIAAFQTFQIAALKGKVSVRPASVAPATSNSGLQEMVGGC